MLGTIILRNLLITTDDVNPANIEVNFPTGILLASHLPTPHSLLKPFFKPLRSLAALRATNFTKDPKGPASMLSQQFLLAQTKDQFRG